MIVAHRGASIDAPENTIPSFKLAWEMGIDAIEGDFHLTRDGQIACIHDRNTERVAERKLVVKESTLSELRELDVGSYKGNKFKGCVIPTIAEVLSTIPPKKKIYIEIKCGTEIIAPLFDEINGSNLSVDQVVFISFNKEVLKVIKETSPEHKVYVLGTLNHDDSGKIVPSKETILEILNQVSADGISLGQDLITEPLVKSILKQGYGFHVWTVDDKETAKKFKEWGVKSITTNDPGNLSKIR
jgi:glycerophosphoryl diester phosphodiesterase